MRWPFLARRGPRHIPVVGPTEALPGPTSRPRADVPPAPAPALPVREGQSGWQRAQRAWQESGADWEETASAQPDYAASAPYAPEPYAPEEPAAADDSRFGIGPWPIQPPEDPEEQDTPPPLPRRIRPQAFAQPSAFAPSSPFAPSSSFTPSPAPGTTRPFATPPLSAPVAAAAPPLGDSDELFRAWQGSVRAAAGRSPWSARRRPARDRAVQGGAGGRGLGWQVAKIGVPAAVIVTVGAGALLMLTGRANEMLAERASTGPASSGQTGAVSSGQTNGQASAGTAGLTLAGYPGQHGSVGVAALWSAGGTTMAGG
jgi:hypothetical protein